jgi:Cysteine-rich CWC
MDNSTCPRCGGGFRCGANDAEPCACRTLTLDPATLAALCTKYTSCLCTACLRALAAAPAEAMKKAGPV